MFNVQFCIILFYLIRSCIKTSTHWKFDAGSGKVYSVYDNTECNNHVSFCAQKEDILMSLLSHPAVLNNGFWTINFTSLTPQDKINSNLK